MAYEIQFFYVISTVGLFAMLAVASASEKYNPLIVALAILVLGNGIVGVWRDILRPYEALCIFGLFFVHFYWKNHPQMAQLLVARLAKILILTSYMAFFLQLSKMGTSTFSDGNISGVFFERGFMSVLLFLAALSLNGIFRASVIPLLVISGSVFGIFAAGILIFLITIRLNLVLVSISLVILVLAVVLAEMWLKSPFGIFVDLPIIQRLAEGEYHNINTRSLVRLEYAAIRDFYYNPKIIEVILGMGSQDIASGVPHNKLAELGLLSFSIIKIWELIILLTITSKSGMFRSILPFILWIMLSGYIFTLYVPALFLMLMGLFPKPKFQSKENYH